MTIQEVADYLRVQPTTLEAWRTGGVGPTYQVCSQGVRYERTDIEAWLDMRRAAGVDVWVENTDGS